MSYVFAMDPVEERQQLQTLTQDWNGENDFNAGFTEGIPKGIGEGLMRGGAKTAQAVALAGATVPIGIDALVGNTSLEDAYFKNVVDKTDTVDYWTPSATEVGTVGQVLGGLSELALPLAATAGNPSLFVASQSLPEGKRLIDEGVDASTAQSLVMHEASFAGLGAWLPIFGNSRLSKIAIGATSNTGLGAFAAQANKKLFEENGYPDIAAQYDPFDWQARAVDALVGGAFGALHVAQHAEIPPDVTGKAQIEPPQMPEVNLKPSDIDAITQAANIKNWQIDSAPGRPIDEASWNQHGDAMETAARQILNDEPVNIIDQIEGASFKPKDINDIRSVADELLAEHADFAPIENVRQIESLESKDTAKIDEIINKQNDSIIVERDLQDQINSITLKDKVKGLEPALQREGWIKEQTPEGVKYTKPDTLSEASVSGSPLTTEGLALQEYISKRGDFEMTFKNNDGQETKTATEFLTEADQQIQEADSWSKGILAAAKCFLAIGVE